MTTTANRIECSGNHGPHFFHFTVKTTDSREDTVGIYLCEKCYNALKAQIVQDVINEAAKHIVPLGFWRRQRGL